MSTPQEIKIMSQIGNEDFQHPIWQMEIAGDCSAWILFYIALKALVEGQLKLEDGVAADAILQAKQIDQSDLVWNSNNSVLQLLQCLSFSQNVVVQQLLGSQLFGNWQQAQIEISSTAGLFGLNIQHQQGSTQNTLQKLYGLAKAIFHTPIELLKLIFVKALKINGQEVAPAHSLSSCTQLDAVIYLKDQNQPYYFSYAHSNQTLGIFQLFDQLHRVDHLAPYYHSFQQGLLPVKQIQAKSEWVNIIGDTYFGEFYTEKRKNKGIDDALQRYGYSHSLEAIKHFFGPNDINIANLEAVFNLEENSILDGKKAYILGAKSEPTLAEFKRIHINTVCLANNHLKDYGERSLKHTLALLEQAEIDFIGAGTDQQQAHQCLEIKNDEGQCLAIFNGYWHRKSAYQEYNFYALGNSAGVACINAILFEQVMQYRLQHPKHKIIVICHWGVDFKSIHPEQQKLAKVLTQIGADLVIGHGAHTIQSIQSIHQKPVIFGIGNGVFNSNGLFEKYQALPYGAIARINLNECRLRLYPIYTHNQETFWQPRPVDELQFKQALCALTSQLDSANYIIGQDDLGHYLQLNV
ncbi:CapA family protein [Acinetobacter sp. C26M]|uniref:CapA family protein n=1 Tax=unclassified Acinetobacter TaxID=196816 RepID=UPI0020375214|nr:MULTISPECIES: CapA family protein [unclassified Acinetobacter]USA45783.1 CapA family protein [Acinetobacter sp. C26M]USA49282.1 CapA family protein [Acinetobacter sp. C26G]